MQTKIALIRCPCVTLPFPPDLAVGYLRAVIARAGYDVKVLDYNWTLYGRVDEATRDAWHWYGADTSQYVRMSAEVFQRFMPEIVAEIDGLIASGYRVFGLSVWEMNRDNSIALARIIKGRDPRCVVIFGGPDCMPRWHGDRLAQEPAVDAVVYGEGELTVLELLGSYEAGGRLAPCAGAYVRQGADMVQGPPRPVVHPDRLPFPDFSDYDLSLVDKQLPIAFNRGCAWRCAFCSVPGYIPEFRSRSAEGICAELEHQVGRYGISSFFESSPTANSDMKELLKLCDLIIGRKLAIEWEGFAVFHPLMDEAAIEKLSRTGCYCLNFGLESGSQRVLDAMGKRFKLAHAEAVLRDMKRHGIDAAVCVMVGFPGETEADFQATIDFIKRNAGYISTIGSVSVMGPQTYSPISERFDAWGIIPDNEPPGAWHLRDFSNTHAIRQDRRRRMIEALAPLGLVREKRPSEESDRQEKLLREKNIPKPG
ncbi:MAG: radical SAM protein [Elusimicrobia bacterium]|nr:radical SAM protein [Elusimicrobiota bacterium]